MCLECGFYNGKQVVDMAAKKAARTKRLEAKKAAIAEQAAQFAPETDATETNPETTAATDAADANSVDEKK
jgi:hypothetical protein